MDYHWTDHLLGKDDPCSVSREVSALILGKIICSPMSQPFIEVMQNESKSQPSQCSNVGFICSLCACVRAYVHTRTHAPALPPAVLWIASPSPPEIQDFPVFPPSAGCFI